MEKHKTGRPKPTFESVLAQAPQALQSEMRAMDAYLKALRPLKFRRVVDKSGRIKYVAPEFGISYGMNVLEAESHHHFGWYFLYDKIERKWYLKSDRMEEVLAEIAETDPGLAEKIFLGLKECSLCKSPSCGQIEYEYNGKEKTTCYGRVRLRLCAEDFSDARAFFGRLNGLIARGASA